MFDVMTGEFREYSPKSLCNFGGGSSPSGSTTTVQKSDPWEGQQPYLKQAMGEAQRLYDTKNPQYNMDAYNQALQAWQTANQGQTPQYDQNAYDTALKAWQSNPGGGPTVTKAMNSGDGNRWVYNLSDGSSVNGTGGQYQVGQSIGGGAPKGAAPTLEQYLIPGAAGARPNQNDYILPGTNQSALSPQAFQGDTFAPFSPETQQAQQMIKDRALAGSPVNDAAQSYGKNLLSGDYLNSNPWLDQTFNKAADQVQSRVNSAFGQGGRFGSGINQEVMGKSMGDLATSVYGGNYDAERNRMQQGLLFAPQLANQDYVDAGQLAGVGAQKEGQAQLGINDQINRFNIEQQAPMTALQRYQQLINGNFGGTTTATQPYYENKGANALGMGLGGVSLLSGIGDLMGAGGLFSMFSDERLKTDITPAGYENGHEIFHYRYKWDEPGTLRRGCMAQKVMRTHPTAVFMDGEYMKVDYAMIGVEPARIH